MSLVSVVDMHIQSLISWARIDDIQTISNCKELRKPPKFKYGNGYLISDTRFKHQTNYNRLDNLTKQIRVGFQKGGLQGD